MKKFGLESASSIRTPMSPNDKLTVNLLGKSVDPFLYKSMIYSLLFLTASRPDISYSVRVCARYQANPKESHMTTLKRIINYVKTTAEFDVLGKSVDPFLYKSMIGSLLYLTASRSDISYSVRVCARYQANPKESHMIALKRIIK